MEFGIEAGEDEPDTVNVRKPCYSPVQANYDAADTRFLSCTL